MTTPHCGCGHPFGDHEPCRTSGCLCHGYHACYCQERDRFMEQVEANDRLLFEALDRTQYVPLNDGSS